MEGAMPATVDGLRTSEAARMIGVSEQTIRTWVRRGMTPHVATPLGALLDSQAVHDLAARREAAAQLAVLPQRYRL